LTTVVPSRAMRSTATEALVAVWGGQGNRVRVTGLDADREEVAVAGVLDLPANEPPGTAVSAAPAELGYVVDSDVGHRQRVGPVSFARIGRTRRYIWPVASARSGTSAWPGRGVRRDRGSPSRP